MVGKEIRHRGKKRRTSADQAKIAALQASPLPVQWLARYHEIYPEVSPQLTQVLFAVRSSALLLDNAITGRLTTAGLTSARYHLLVVAWGWGGPISFSKLGAYLTVSRATVSALVDGLVRDGFVARTADPDDRRNALIQLTDHGEAVLKPMLDRNFRDMHHAFADFDESELKTLLALLDRFRTNTQDLQIVQPSA